jgi:hypothetical protein
MATVVDSDALEQRRSQLGPRTHVQVVDPRINRELEQGLERQLQAIQTLASTNQEQVAPLDLSPEERDWLAGQSPAVLRDWENDLRQAQRRMLQQGLVSSVAHRQPKCSWRTSPNQDGASGAGWCRAPSRTAATCGSMPPSASD